MDTFPIFPKSGENGLPVLSDSVRFLGAVTKPYPYLLGKKSGDSLRIGFVLPFLTGTSAQDLGGEVDNPVSRWAVHYYLGAKLAIQDMVDQFGLNIGSQALDSGADTLSLKTNLESNPGLSDLDIVIGPYHRDNIRLLAGRAREDGYLLFSPFSASAGPNSDNPYFFQINPPIEVQVTNVVHHLLDRFEVGEVLLLQKDSDTRLRDLFLKTFAATNPGKEVPKALLLSSRTQDWAPQLAAELAIRDNPIIVISSYSDEIFLNNLLQALFRETIGKKDIAVYGLSPWLNMEKLDFSMLEALHFHVASPFFADPSREEVQAFRTRFLDEIGQFPDEAAFQGYDLLRFLLEGWRRQSDDFIEALLAFKNPNYLSVPLRFAEWEDTSPGGGARKFWINREVQVLQFSGYTWTKD